ncbi:hypothetical protein [Actinomadura nitritigenes]
MLAHPAVQVAIVGSRRKANLEQTVGALDVRRPPVRRGRCR